MKNIKDHHCFKIVSEEETGKALIFSKKWSSDNEWIPATSRDDAQLYFLIGHPTADAIPVAPTQFHKIGRQGKL